MKIKFQNLNQNESYACTKQDIKKVVTQEDDIFINFGNHGRSFSFDSKFIKRPHIDGQIIVSISINKRLNISDANPSLSFYVIRDEMYDQKYRNIFCESILPKIHDWYDKTLSNTNSFIPGVYELLVEWTGDSFKLHDCRFA